jgi:hypothetical protein
MYFQINSLDTAAASNNKISNSFIGLNNPGNGAQMAVGYSLISTYVLQNLSGLLTTNTNIAVVNGTLVLNVPSLNTALIIRKTVPLAGRAYQARFMVPPMRVAETDVSPAGVISGTTGTINTTNWNNFFTNLNTGTNPRPYLIHGPGKTGITPPPTAISSFDVVPLIGTIRRRIRS